MKLSLDDLNRYGDGLNAIASESSRVVADEIRLVLDEMFEKYGDISTWSREQRDEFRKLVTDTMVESWEIYGDASSSLGSLFFEETLGDEMPDKAMMLDHVSRARAESSARYWMGNLFGEDADADRFVDGCASFVERNVSHAADMAVMDGALALGEEGKRIKFGRVPVGPTCGFCIMLASRGFVYANKRSAGDEGGAFNRFHDKCNCRVVAGYEGLEVEGYDYKGMYDRYKACRNAIGGYDQLWDDWCALSQEEKDKYGRSERVGGDDPEIDAWTRAKIGNQANAVNDYMMKRIVQEMNERDREWLYSGKTPSPTFETDELEQEIVSNRPHELRTAARLNGHGVPTPFHVDERHYFDEEQGVWQTVGLADCGNGYELKTLQDASWSSVDDYLRKTAKKEGVRAVVIDNFENRSALSDAELIRKLQEQTRWDGPIYVITHDDEYIRVPKKNASEVPLRDQPGRIDSIAHAASSMEEHRSPKPTTEVRPLGGVPGDPDVTRNRNGLGLGSHRGIAPGTPTLVEVVDFDKTPLEEVLANYEDEIATLEVEHAIIIRPNGEVWRSVGDKRSVNIESDDLDLTGTVVTHNHVVIEEVESSSFSKEDFEQLQQAPEIDELRARYGGYHYSMKPTDKTVDGSWDDARGRLQVGNVSEDIKHDVMVELDAEGIIVYSRERVSSDR